MKTIYFKAYDQVGGKRSGTIEAEDSRAADIKLRKSGLRPYFLHDYKALKKKIRHKRRRQKALVLGGAIIVGIALIGSGLMVGYAGREQQLDVEDLTRIGAVEGASGLIVAKSATERRFGLEAIDIWNSFAPDCVTGLEVKKLLMIIYVSKKIHALSDDELEMLANSTARALQRRFNSSGCTLLVIEKTKTILEVQYNAFTKTTKVRSYR